MLDGARIWRNRSAHPAAAVRIGMLTPVEATHVFRRERLLGRGGLDRRCMLDLGGAKATLSFAKIPRARTALSQFSSKPANFAESIDGCNLELLDLHGSE